MAKDDEYREHYLDFKDPHESNEFYVRLLQVFEQSHHTLQSLSDAINVPKRTLQRFINKETHGDTIRMIYDVAYACGMRPEVFFDRKIQIANLELTGVKSIDRMLVDCYNNTSRTGLDGFDRYIANNYRLRHDRWRKEAKRGTNSRITSLLVEDEDGCLGLSFADEVKLNDESAVTNRMTKRLRLHRAYIVCDLVNVAYSIAEIHESENYPSKAVLRHADHLKLEQPIAFYKENPRVRPKICIRQWKQIKEPVETNQFDRSSVDLNRRELKAS